jgi:hypothetical protein
MELVTELARQAGWEFGVEPGPGRRDVTVLERWLEEGSGGEGPDWFLEGYRSLRARGWAAREAFCIAWLSLGRDDRGELGTVAELCDFLGVSRMWFYEHKARYDNEPVRGQNAWEWWAERLQLERLRGSRLADVDEAVYRRAVSEEGKAADRELFYKRAGVLVQRTELSASVGQAVDVSGLSDAELDALVGRDAAVRELGRGEEPEEEEAEVRDVAGGEPGRGDGKTWRELGV